MVLNCALLTSNEKKGLIIFGQHFEIPTIVKHRSSSKDIAYFCSTFSATVKKTMQKDTQFIGASGFDNQGLRNV